MLYRHKYVTSDRFDNFYITYDLRDIDERRKELGRESILPLTFKETGKYVKASKLPNYVSAVRVNSVITSYRRPAIFRSVSVRFETDDVMRRRTK